MPKPKRVLKYLEEENWGKLWKTVWKGSLFYFMYYYIMCINWSTKTWKGENPKFTVNLQQCGLILHTNTDQVWQSVSCASFRTGQSADWNSTSDKSGLFLFTHPGRLWVLPACHPSVTKDSFLTEWGAEAWRFSFTYYIAQRYERVELCLNGKVGLHSGLPS